MKTTTRVLKTWSKRNVPEDIWPEILSKLPVKSLLRFRSVCKSWRTVIDDPYFARLHLTRFNNNRHQSHLFAVQGTYPKGKWVVKSRTNLRTTASLSELDRHIKDNIIVCSIDGLFLLSEIIPQNSLLLCNPSIRKTLILVIPPEICGIRVFEFGLGFDPSIQDYKVVRFVLGRYLIGVQSVAIYTVGTNSWKSIGFEGKGCSTWRQSFGSDPVYYGHATFCVRGVLYARAHDHVQNPQKLVSFDLSSELFASTALPEVQNMNMSCEKLMTVDNGSSLAMFYMSVVKKKGCIWVLENLENDVESSNWIPRYTFGPLSPLLYDIGDYPFNLSFLYFNKNGELLLAGRTNVISINLETKVENIVLKKKLYGPAGPYVESLLLH